MAKKKGVSRQARLKARRAAANPILRGQEALRQGDYDGAIAVWEQANRETPSARLTAALAEVYFRRGLARFYRQQQQDAGLSDLDKAARLAPDRPHYSYHLGLAHHRLGNLEIALTAYRLALDADPTFSRAAEMAILSMLEKDRNPIQTAEWKALPPARQAELMPLVGLVCGQSPAGRKAQTGSPPSDAGQLWSALAALQAGDSRARDTLRAIAQAADRPPPVRALAAYALGVEVLQQEPHNLEAAQGHWEAARRLGLDTPALRDNLKVLYHCRAEAAMAAARWDEAASLADAALALDRTGPELRELALYAHLHAGYAEAQAGRWGQALEHWRQAQSLGENSRPLIQNLALACEKNGHFLEAAGLWREVIRRRPRKANAADALTPQQVALLWGHVADCYRRAGRAEEAIATLRNAIKNDPDNPDLRLELVDALAADGHWNAASNEVGRILDRQPNHVGALVRAARIDEGDGYLARARKLWKQVLTLEPKHLEARERLADLLRQEGNRLAHTGKPDQALASYREALEYTPEEADLILDCAFCHFLKQDPQAARQEMERAFALKPLDLDLYHMAVDLCHAARQPEEAEWVIGRAEELAGPAQKAGHLPATFYLGIADSRFKRHQTGQGEEYLRRAEKAAAGDPDELVEVGSFYLDHDNTPRALHFFDQALRLDPEHGWANYHVGASYGAAGEMREANRYWRQARRTARKTGDEELLEAIEQTRRSFERFSELIERGADPTSLLSALAMYWPDEEEEDDSFW